MSSPRRDVRCHNVTVSTDAVAACRHAHAIVVLTEWNEFKDIDFEAVYQVLSHIKTDALRRLCIEIVRLQQSEICCPICCEFAARYAQSNAIVDSDYASMLYGLFR